VIKELRKYPRRKLHLEVELSFPSGEKQTVRTQDVSDGGVFLIVDKLRRPIIGEVIEVKIVNDENELGVEFPSNDAVVVRQEEGGIGLAFIELDFDNE
jgi:c-di-GMP-binding flagellar brake protein YcgR